MKRSQVNAIMRAADEFICRCGFHLPPFAYWTLAEWHDRASEATEIIEHKLGWDITDFGSGDFEHTGLFLFTLRNGHPRNRHEGGKLYAEKVMVVEESQVTPMHFHWKKMEDIINRSGGTLAIQLYNSTLGESLDFDTPVTVSVDGIRRTLPAGGVLYLSPGESISLTPRLYHKFWGEGGRVLVGEVSLVNDDARDNRFLDQVGRFPRIEEDEEPLYLLVNDSEVFWR